jgi:hypothetical protein
MTTTLEVVVSAQVMLTAENYETTMMLYKSLMCLI